MTERLRHELQTGVTGLQCEYAPQLSDVLECADKVYITELRRLKVVNWLELSTSSGGAYLWPKLLNSTYSHVQPQSTILV